MYSAFNRLIVLIRETRPNGEIIKFYSVCYIISNYLHLWKSPFHDILKYFNLNSLSFFEENKLNHIEKCSDSVKKNLSRETHFQWANIRHKTKTKRAHFICPGSLLFQLIWPFKISAIKKLYFAVFWVLLLPICVENENWISIFCKIREWQNSRI